MGCHPPLPSKLVDPATGASCLTLPASRGHLGVDIFFILSGFILSYVYAAGDQKFGFKEYGKFIWYRVARIFPNHLASLGLLLFFVVAAHLHHVQITGRYPISHLPFQLTLTHVWPFVPGIQGGEWVGASWSLSAEWFCYVFVFPGIAFIHRRNWGVPPSLAVAYAIISVWIFCPQDVVAFLPVSYNLLKAIFEFAVGGLVFTVYLHRGAVTRFCQKWVTAIAVVLIGLIGFANLPLEMENAFTVPLFPLLLVGLTNERSWAGRFLSTRPILWFGRISYALYISHGVALRVLKVVLPWDRYQNHSLGVRIAVFAANLGLILFFAAILHYGVEFRARNYLRRIRP